MRRSSGELMLNQIIATSEVKQWNLLLSSNENKNKLCEFLVKEWKSKEEVFQFINNEITSIPELWCDHQEADTRMLVHAKHASLSYQSVVIHSPDTDVFILALAKSLKLESNLFMDTGTIQTRRIIDITAVGNEVFTTSCNADCSKDMFFDALLGDHSFTGCDRTSAFAEKGKKKL